MSLISLYWLHDGETRKILLELQMNLATAFKLLSDLGEILGNNRDFTLNFVLHFAFSVRCFQFYASSCKLVKWLCW